MEPNNECTEETNEIGLNGKIFLDVSDVLPIFKCTEATFRNWLNKGKLPNELIAKIGNTVKIRSHVLNQYLMGNI